MEVPKRRVLRVVYFYLKSNLPSLINDSDEGSDSVPGDGEMKKREGERASRFIWTRAGGERERASALVRGGMRWVVVGIPVCSVQGWGADWRTLTSAQQEQLDSITSSTEGSYAAALHGRGLWKGKGGGDRTVQAANQHNATPSGARGNWVNVPVLNEPLQRPQGWARGSVREVVEAISVTVMSVCFLPSTSLLLCLICSVILHTVRLFTRTKMKWSVFSFTKTFCPT